jgi:hypothetical protein
MAALPPTYTLTSIFRDLDVNALLGVPAAPQLDPATGALLPPYINLNNPPNIPAVALTPANALNDARFQIRGCLSAAMTQPAIFPEPIKVYGATNNLLMLGVATTHVDVFNAMSAFNMPCIRITQLNLAADPTYPANPMGYGGLLLQNLIAYMNAQTNMCYYSGTAAAAPPTHSFRSRSLIDYIKSRPGGMRVAYASNILQTWATDPMAHPHRYGLFLWDCTTNHLAGFIMFKYIDATTPATYEPHPEHMPFHNYLHVLTFCANQVTATRGMTILIAILRAVCLTTPLVGIVLDSISSLQTLLTYYAIGFRSCVRFIGAPHDYRANANWRALYSGPEHVMAWIKPGSRPPNDHGLLHTVPEVVMDPTNQLNDLRAFILIALHGCPYPTPRTPDMLVAMTSVVYNHFRARPAIRELTLPERGAPTIITGGAPSDAPLITDVPTVVETHYINDPRYFHSDTDPFGISQITSSQNDDFSDFDINAARGKKRVKLRTKVNIRKRSSLNRRHKKYSRKHKKF